ncbi:unnamed protein product [Boreogadus saida]
MCMDKRLAVATVDYGSRMLWAEHILQNEKVGHTDHGPSDPPRSRSRSSPGWTDPTCPESTPSHESCLRPHAELACLLPATPGPERRSVLWTVIMVSSPSRRMPCRLRQLTWQRS